METRLEFLAKNLIEHVNKLLINSVSCVNAAAQFAGIAALDGSDDSIDEMMKKFTIRRKLIHEGLNNLPGVECSLPGGVHSTLFPSHWNRNEWF